MDEARAIEREVSGGKDKVWNRTVNGLIPRNTATFYVRTPISNFIRVCLEALAFVKSGRSRICFCNKYRRPARNTHHLAILCWLPFPRAEADVV
jgi:hypothetical protein